MLDAFGEDGVSVFFIPMFEGAEYPNMGAGGPEIAISITEYSENQQLATEFLKFLAEPANQDIFVELRQTQASNHVDGDASKIQNPLLKAEFEELQTATDGVVFAFDSVMPQATIDLFYRVNAAVFSAHRRRKTRSRSSRRRTSRRSRTSDHRHQSPRGVASAAPAGGTPRKPGGLRKRDRLVGCSPSFRPSSSSSGSWRSRSASRSSSRSRRRTGAPSVPRLRQLHRDVD